MPAAPFCGPTRILNRISPAPLPFGEKLRVKDYLVKRYYFPKPFGGILLAILMIFGGPGRHPAVGAPAEGDNSQAIPITFTLRQPAFVTLVIEDPQGKRVRNLISEQPFPAGVPNRLLGRTR